MVILYLIHKLLVVILVHVLKMLNYFNYSKKMFIIILKWTIYMII